MKFVIGSASERKIKVAEKIIGQFLRDENFTVLGYPSVSRVPETPYDMETFQGAFNRAEDAKIHVSDADIYIGLESGLVERYGHTFEEAWGAVITSDDKRYHGYSSGLKVPDLVLEKMKELNKEHCDVMEILEEECGKLPNDTWGSYSGGILLRETSLEEALRNALVQLFSPDNSFYKKS